MTRAELDRRVERFKEASRKAGIKLTQQRLEIFREVAASSDHPDADTVFNGVLRRLPTVSLDTVYRTLWTLTDLGLLGTLGPRREKARFDANLSPHHHFVCLRCGSVRDFQSPELDALRVPAEGMALGAVVATHVELHGVCAGCAGKLPSRSSRGATSATG